jgi:hypothetical protein
MHITPEDARHSKLWDLGIDRSNRLERGLGLGDNHRVGGKLIDPRDGNREVVDQRFGVFRRKVDRVREARDCRISG